MHGSIASWHEFRIQQDQTAQAGDSERKKIKLIIIFCLFTLALHAVLHKLVRVCLSSIFNLFVKL